MGKRYLFLAAAVATGVIAVVTLIGSGLLAQRTAVMVDDGAQLVSGLAATGVCWWTAARRAGAERRWRIWMGAGIAGWTMGMAVWAWYRSFADTPLPSPSLADVGFFVLPVLALPALLAFARGGTPVSGGHVIPTRHTVWADAVLLLDGLVVAGSLFLLTWSTALGAVVNAGAQTSLTFGVAVAYPLTDLALVVIVVLIASFRRVRQPRQLLVLGIGLVALAVSDSIFAYLVSSGAEEMHLVADAGFIAGPALIALAAAARDPTTSRSSTDLEPGALGWWHLLLPYLPLLAAGSVIVGQTLAGSDLDGVRVFGGIVIVVLVVLRQLLTLIENTSLLGRVHQAQQRLVHQASHDPLTGLANRRLFEDQLAEAINASRTNRWPLGLLFIDLDDFKAVNDDLGHYAGDALLQAVADRLRGCLRASDTVARLGGDEFALLLEGAWDLERIHARVAAALRRPFPVGERLRRVNASIGLVVAEPTESELSAETLLQRADAAMYSAKRRRKAQLALDWPGTRGAPDIDTDLAMRLAGVLSCTDGSTDINVHYQPIVRITDGSPVAVEALVRWAAPTLTAVTPGALVATAEHAGLVADLDNFVLDRACREFVSLNLSQTTSLSLHVNLSAGRLGDSELVRSVGNALHRYDLPGGQLVLEITETSFVPDLDAATDVLEQLRRLDVRFALDDFGTGYNTLVHLHRFPVDMVKLDQSFTTTPAHSSLDPTRAKALRRSVLSIARALGIGVIVEGVETIVQAEELSRQGYGLAQGYLYGRPGPLAELTQLDRASTGRK